MKISHNFNNYQFQKNNVFPQKQETQTNSAIADKKIFAFLSSNSLAFKGEIEQNQAAKEINDRIVRQIERIGNDNWTKVTEELNIFKTLINDSSFKYDENITQNFDKMIASSRFGNGAYLIKALKANLYLKILAEQKVIPKEVNEYFQNNKDEFCEVFYNGQSDEIFDEEVPKKAFARLKKEFKFNINDDVYSFTRAGACKYYKCAKFLYEQGADPYKKDEAGATFYQYVEYNELMNILNNPESKKLNEINSKNIYNPQDLIQSLKDKSFDINDIEGKTAEEFAKENIKDENQLKQTLSIIQEIRKPLAPQDEQFLNLVKMGLPEGLDILLEFNDNVNLNVKDKDGDGALHIAYNNKDMEMLKKLLQNPEIDPNMTNIYGNTIGIRASIFNDKEILNYLVENPPERFDPNYINSSQSSPTTILNTVISDFIDKVLEMKGLDVNLSAPNMDPALIQFAKAENLNKFSKLLQHPDIDINKPGIDGKTVFDAIDDIKDYDKKQEFLKALELSKSLDSLNKIRNITDLKGTPSLDFLNEYLKSPNIQEIINKPVSVAGETIAHFLPELKVNVDNLNEIVSLYEIFIKSNPDINVKDKYGLTPLMKAVWAENDFAVEFLLKNGANKYLKNENGESAVVYAANAKSPYIRKLFGLE